MKKNPVGLGSLGDTVTTASASSGTRPLPPDAATTPRPILRRVGGPLLLYHVLILVGAYFVFWGYANGSRTLEVLGVLLVSTGIVTELTVLAWSANLTRRSASRVHGTPGRPPQQPGPTRELASWQCVRCGRIGSGAILTCPSCGGPAVRPPRFEA